MTRVELFLLIVKRILISEGEDVLKSWQLRDLQLVSPDDVENDEVGRNENATNLSWIIKLDSMALSNFITSFLILKIRYQVIAYKLKQKMHMIIWV